MTPRDTALLPSGRGKKQPTISERIEPEVQRLHETFGMGRGEIARELDVRPQYVTDAAKRLGIVFDRARTQTAIDAARRDTEHRLSLAAKRSSEIAEKASNLMIDALKSGTVVIANARDLREVAVAFGISSEKATQLLAAINPTPDNSGPFEQLLAAIENQGDQL